MKSSVYWAVIFLTVVQYSGIFAKECIKTKVGFPCKKNEDCHTENELHLYCNKTKKAYVCAFHLETYIGHASKNIDCKGAEFSAEPWSNPVPPGLISLGMDCMRMCLHVQTCFGISIAKRRCYLRNEKCFSNLKRRKGTNIGALNVVREDYRCGCHYPFTRTTSDGRIITWSPACPEHQLTRNPYRCCSEKGLCIKCDSDAGNETSLSDSHQLASFQLR